MRDWLLRTMSVSAVLNYGVHFAFVFVVCVLLFRRSLTQMHTRTHTHTRTHARTHTNDSFRRNWVLILVGAEIPWGGESFQFGFKRWQGWAVSKVLWEWFPNVWSKARESAKAMSLAFVLQRLLFNSVTIYNGISNEARPKQTHKHCTVLQDRTLDIHSNLEP